MMNLHGIEIRDFDDGENLIRVSTRAAFEVVISNDRYKELKTIADDQIITEAEALERVIREGFYIKTAIAAAEGVK
jgi:hypothetical protein